MDGDFEGGIRLKGCLLMIIFEDYFVSIIIQPGWGQQIHSINGEGRGGAGELWCV